MSHDVDLLQFVSEDEIDKVVATGSITISNSGPSGTNYATSGRIVENSVPNPYGKKCMVRFRWTNNYIDYNSPDTIIQYAFTVDATAWGGPVSDPIPGVQGAVAAGCSASAIKFRTYNGLHGNVAYTGTAMSPGPDSFSGVPLDFHIEYVLLEVD